jgi:hypothetical protein
VAPKSPLRKAISRLARELAVHPESALASLG